MKLAFCLYKYFPFGGMQRDFLRIALACAERGCEVRVYTLDWSGEIPAALEVIIVPARGFTQHVRYQRFTAWIEEQLRRDPVDAVVGFNKMPGLDLYYAADSCYEEKARSQRGWLYRLMPRYRHFRSYEEAVFARQATTSILLLSDQQQMLFQKYYDTPAGRFHLLPPGVSRDRLPPQDANEVRKALRAEFDVSHDQQLLLLVGSGFITKGLDRVLRGIAALPPALAGQVRLIAIGQDNPRRFQRMARRLGVDDRVEILPGREDIPRFLLGADLLVHPAYVENTGTVLLEALINGLPVLTTDVCGYAPYVTASGGGIVMASPFDAAQFVTLLEEMLCPERRESWQKRGLEFGRTADIYSMPERAAELIADRVGIDALPR